MINLYWHLNKNCFKRWKITRLFWCITAELMTTWLNIESKFKLDGNIMNFPCMCCSPGNHHLWCVTWQSFDDTPAVSLKWKMEFCFEGVKDLFRWCIYSLPIKVKPNLEVSVQLLLVIKTQKCFIHISLSIFPMLHVHYSNVG